MKQETATLAGGCFWCTEAIFRRLKGVSSVIPGYAGGTVPNPTYDQVCTGKTGHAEAIQVTFDPSVLSYAALLDVFFHLHDPTTKNQQGADVGSQYRSAIFYHSDEQKKIAQGHMKPEYVTELTPYTNFYPAEEHHQDYYAKNSYAPYCQVVIDPKINKLMEKYPELTT
jgi:peptide-methionine (S)-S-oxide reductase